MYAALPSDQGHRASLFPFTSGSLALELGLLLGEEGLVADAEILGAEAVEAFAVLRVGEGARVAQAPREFLVPARDERRTVGDSPRRGLRLGFDLVVRDDARHETQVLRLGGIEHASLEHDLERVRFARKRDQRSDLGVGHDEAELVDRHAEAARRAADANVREPGDLETATHADAVDLGNHRMTAMIDRVDRLAHDRPVLARLLDVRALVREFRDVVPGREGLRARAANNDAAHLVARGKLREYL